MDRERDEDRDQREQERDYPDESAPGQAPGSADYKDVVGIQMFAYCDVHNKRFPAGDDCPEC